MPQKTRTIHIFRVAVAIVSDLIKHSKKNIHNLAYCITVVVPYMRLFLAMSQTNKIETSQISNWFFTQRVPQTFQLNPNLRYWTGQTVKAITVPNRYAKAGTFWIVNLHIQYWHLCKRLRVSTKWRCFLSPANQILWNSTSFTFPTDPRQTFKNPKTPLSL